MQEDHRSLLFSPKVLAAFQESVLSTKLCLYLELIDFDSFVQYFIYF